MKLLRTSVSDFAGQQMVMGLDDNGYGWVKAVDVQKVVGKPDNSYRDFLAGKSLEAIQAKAYSSGEKMFKVVGYNKPVKFIPTQAVAFYWHFQASKGNKLARCLVTADLAASLHRQASETNGQQVTAAEHETLRATINQELVAAFLSICDQLELKKQELLASEDDSVPANVYYKAKAEYDQLYRQYQKAKHDNTLGVTEMQAIQKVHPYICF
jgi:hypothetical protein